MRTASCKTPHSSESKASIGKEIHKHRHTLLPDLTPCSTRVPHSRSQMKPLACSRSALGKQCSRAAGLLAGGSCA